MKTPLFIRATKYYQGDQNEEGKMGEACGRYWGRKKFIRGFGGES
jgi:hypothetical protein